MAQLRILPSLPRIGLSEREYRGFIEEAERYRDRHAREAHKVGMYVTRAIVKCTSWAEKEKCFKHALLQHCHAPPESDEDTLTFYGHLAHLVREHAGAELLKYVSSVDDQFAARLSGGEPRESVTRDAHAYFNHLIPLHHKPEWINLEDFKQVKVFSQQW